jgi:hypothetical protein
MMFTLAVAVELPLERHWQASSESFKDTRHREGGLFCSAREGIPEVYHVGIYPRIEIGLEGPRRKLDRHRGHLSRQLGVPIL